MPFSLTNAAAAIWRDYNTEGVPASGRYSPRKSQVRTWGTEIQNYLNGTTALDQLNITGGNIGGATTFTGLTTPIPLASGGTGANTAATARTALGGTAVGVELFTAADAAVARTSLGAGATGVSLFQAADAAAARTAIGAGATGATLIQAANAAAGRSAIGLGAVTISTAAPSGGADGDLWFQYA